MQITLSFCSSSTYDLVTLWIVLEHFKDLFFYSDFVPTSWGLYTLPCPFPPHMSIWPRIIPKRNVPVTIILLLHSKVLTSNWYIIYLFVHGICLLSIFSIIMEASRGKVSFFFFLLFAHFCLLISLFLQYCIPSTQNSLWHIVNIQYIFIG